MNYQSARPLFVITYKDRYTTSVPAKDELRSKFATQETIDLYRHYEAYGVEVCSQERAPRDWPTGTTIEIIKSHEGRCYPEVLYRVESPVALREEDFAILRAQSCFMGGQETGVLQNLEALDDGTCIYYLRSICDSSD